MKDEKVVYVNYSPYENQGKILDFLLEEYKTIFLFSIAHHNIKRKQVTNKLTIYQNGKVYKEIDLFFFPLHSSLVFLFLPVRSFLNFWQILWQSQKLKKEFGNIHLYFTVNGFAAWVGLVLRKFEIVEKTIYWVCDYYPLQHDNQVIKAMRHLYWEFEKKAAMSDKVAFHNMRLVDVWKEHGIFSKNHKPLLIPIATGKTKIRKNKNLNNIKVCFLGVLKKSQGLDFIFDSANELKKEFPNIIIEIIGPGIDEEYFKKRAKDSKLKTNFHGYVSEVEIDDIISQSTIGIAPYMPDPSTVSYYGDPGKIKRYISLGLPVIATSIHEFSKELGRSKAGILIEYGNTKQLVEAIREIKSEYHEYSNNAANLNKKYFYKDIYPKMFDI